MDFGTSALDKLKSRLNNIKTVAPINQVKRELKQLLKKTDTIQDFYEMLGTLLEQNQYAAHAKNIRIIDVLGNDTEGVAKVDVDAAAILAVLSTATEEHTAKEVCEALKLEVTRENRSGVLVALKELVRQEQAESRTVGKGASGSVFWLKGKKVKKKTAKEAAAK